MNETAMNLAMIMLWGLLLLFTVTPVSGFVPLRQSGWVTRVVAAPTTSTSSVVELLHDVLSHPSSRRLVLRAAQQPEEDEEQDEETKENPYSDPNYPDLEFINYDDPDYVVDQGGEEEFRKDSTEEQIEEMREDRRRRNDEYQFQTYFKKLLSEGREYKGDWSVYQTSTFLEAEKDNVVDANGFPRMLKSKTPLHVTSRAKKTTVETDSLFPTDAERINHEETVSVRDDKKDDEEVGSEAEEEANKVILGSPFWPEALSAFDFRGEKAIMCVGNAYTICTTVSLQDDEENQDDITEGPFAEYRAEMGIFFKELRFRVKFDYRMKDDEKEEYLKSNGDVAPPLCLKSMVICRETLERWPPGPDDEYTSASEQVLSDALYGKPGAEGGLYDPPPVGDEDQAGKYMLLDLEGGATLLFPYEMEQDPAAFEGNGWVTSLDWTPGTYRYQVDRKVKGGLELRNLRTLELSEVQGADADQYRPRDGGEDMRQ